MFRICRPQWNAWSVPDFPFPSYKRSVCCVQLFLSVLRELPIAGWLHPNFIFIPGLLMVRFHHFNMETWCKTMWVSPLPPVEVVGSNFNRSNGGLFDLKGNFLVKDFMGKNPWPWKDGPGIFEIFVNRTLVYVFSRWFDTWYFFSDTLTRCLG